MKALRLHFDKLFANYPYMGFMARLHQRSLAPVWNDFLRLWWPMISGNGWGLNFPEIYLTVEEKPREKLNQENWPDRRSNRGPLDGRQWLYPTTTDVVPTPKKWTLQLQTSRRCIPQHLTKRRVKDFYHQDYDLFAQKLIVVKFVFNT